MLWLLYYVNLINFGVIVRVNCSPRVTLKIFVVYLVINHDLHGGNVARNEQSKMHLSETRITYDGRNGLEQFCSQITTSTVYKKTNQFMTCDSD